MNNNKGVALFISLALLFLLSVAAIVVLLTAYNYANVTENQIKRLRAILLAEAGIHHAYWKLRTDPTYTGDTTKPYTTSPDVVVTVTAEAGRSKIKSKVEY